jgi:hypothetical protein
MKGWMMAEKQVVHARSRRPQDGTALRKADAGRWPGQLTLLPEKVGKGLLVLLQL